MKCWTIVCSTDRVGLGFVTVKEVDDGLFERKGWTRVRYGKRIRQWSCAEKRLEDSLLATNRVGRGHVFL